MGKLEGKTAIVTGAGQGVGRAIAAAYAGEGARVVLATRTVSKAEDAAARIRAAGGDAAAIACDVAVKEDVARVVAFTVERYGTVDILVNNAQVFKNHTSVLDHSDEDVYRVFNSGYMGTWRFMRECFSYMKDRGGKIVNMASAAGVKGLATFAAYASTKEAIRALSRVAAREWGEYGINVNIICPLASSEGLAESTPQEGLDAIAAQLPVRRLGQAEDIAPIAVFLASRDSDYLTGYTFFADGGSSIDAGR